MSIVEFGESCELEMIRITAQSRGLLQIDESRIVPHDWSHGWTLLDISSNNINREPLEYGDLQILKKYLATNIAFVHRSAYDYIFDVINNERPAWLRPVAGPEMIHEILDGALWLAKVQPVVFANPGEVSSRPHTGVQDAHDLHTLRFLFDAIAKDDSAKLDRERVLEGLDKHLRALHTWTAVGKNDPTGTLSSFVAYGRRANLGPWTEFWRSSMRIEPRFLTSRMHRFRDRDDAYLDTIALLAEIDQGRMGRMYSRTEIYHAMRSALTEFRFQGHADSSITDFPYTGERRYCYLASSTRVYSWLGTGSSHERLIPKYLYKVVHDTWCEKRLQDNTHRSQSRGDHEQESPSRAYVLSDIFICTQAIMDTWKLFVGKFVRTSRDGEILSPLLLFMPAHYAQPQSLPYPVDDEAMMNKVLSCKPELTLRLACFAKHGPDRFLEDKGQDSSGTSLFATATYHLSPGITALVMAHCVQENFPLQPSFVGTTAELSSCTDMIPTEIWDDADGQLTAWEQLYVRACMKCYFPWRWKVKEESPDGRDPSEKESA
jgi:hypothetical protein